MTSEGGRFVTMDESAQSRDRGPRANLKFFENSHLFSQSTVRSTADLPAVVRSGENSHLDLPGAHGL